jgi:toxin ParE1/3/4
MGMSYKIIYTEESEQDLVNVYRYIAMNLLMPETAKKQIDRIMNAIKGLDELPLRHKLYQDEPWHSKGLRVLPVDSYLVFYIVIEEEKTVAIVRIMYGGRNIDLQLSNTKIVD